MLDIERALKQDRLLRALTGLNRKAFDALLPTFSEIYEQTGSSQPRQRAVGGGRKARLRHIQDQQFFILFYFKSYPTFDERAPAVWSASLSSAWMDAPTAKSFRSGIRTENGTARTETW